MKIMKFGGTSVGNPDRMKALIPLISDNERKIVVLSAMAGTTNSLVEITDLLYADNINEASIKNNNLRSKYHHVVDELFATEDFKKSGHELIDSHFEYIRNFTLRVFTKLQEKAILAQGELISTSLFHLLLQERNIRSVLLTALSFMRIDKDGEPDSFYIEENIERELKSYPSENIIITQGFICRNAYGEIDNLKRGGSDFTASLIGAAVNASEIQIWTDINGFHNNDPRFVENTQVIRELSFDEAAELAYFGAKILHPSSVNPAREKNIPVRLKNTMDPADKGTLITSSSTLLDYKAVAAKDGISVLRIRSDRMLMAYGFLRKVFEIFEAYRTPIDMITTSEVAVSITIDNPEFIKQIAKDLNELGSVEVEENQTIVCVVGDFRTERTGSAPEIFEALNTIPLKMISYGGSPNSLSLLIDTSNKIEALRLLSKHYLSKTMINNNTIEKFKNIETPFYYYDLEVLRSTLDVVRKESDNSGYKVHYAVKANSNPRILKIISSYGFGADCVSFNEINAAIAAGFNHSEIVFAGVGKTDKDIIAALKSDIFCFNCESIPEIEVINQLAAKQSKTAQIALRINPYIEAHTHKYITTGIEESKFGINTWELDDVIKKLTGLKNIRLIGIHFHIGSQITRMSVFKSLCARINELQEWFSSHNIYLQVINVGGGLGIDYENPEKNPDFPEYFSLLNEFIDLLPSQELHIEPGRSITGQCGSLISKVLFIKNGSNTMFAIIDAGMTDLIRPALYQAHHKIENLTSTGNAYRYDVVGPVCESSDTFAKYIELPETRRGDIIAIRSAGAYGEAMAMRYNLRDLPKSVFSDEL